jgi:hypothetical protein
MHKNITVARVMEVIVTEVKVVVDMAVVNHMADMESKEVMVDQAMVVMRADTEDQAMVEMMIAAMVAH